jgi:O-antigen ligase
MQCWEAWKASRWLQGLTLLFMIPLVSGLWSNDHRVWLQVMQVKLPLLVLPFCVPAFTSLNLNARKILLWALMILLVLSMGQSVWWMMREQDRNYLGGAVMRVPMRDDHVRYAWLLVIGYAWLLGYWLWGYVKNRVLVIGLLVMLAIFIHVLAAKTGIVGFYSVSGLFVIGYFKKRLWVVGLLVMLPLIAWFTVPSFQQRVKFVRWDFQNYSRGNYVEGLNDAPRILSWRAAAEIIREHPSTGAGAGDARQAVQQWYSVHASLLKPYEQLLPANQMLIYGVYAGVAGLLAASFVLLMPLWMKPHRKNILWLSFHLLAVLGFMYEIALEMQFGVAIYLVFSLIFLSEVKSQKIRLD